MGYDRNANYKMNWEKKLDKIEVLLHKWSKRDLSLIGKVQILKSVAMPQITLAATVLNIPDNFIISLNKILYRFLWKSADKIKRTNVIKKHEHGGLNMIDVECNFQALKANWINRLLNANPNINAWAQIPYIYYRYFDIEINGLRYNFDESVKFVEINNLPDFYFEVMLYHNKVYVIDRSEFMKNLGNQSLWGNKFITKKRGRKIHVLFFQNWIKSGIKKLSHLKFINGCIDENFIYNTVRNKSNIHMEILTLKNALLPLKKQLKNVTFDESNPLLFQTTKQIYAKLSEYKTKSSEYSSAYLKQQNSHVNETRLFNLKVKQEKEIKIKEFNFKLLHGILACNRNLKNWRIKDSDKCDLCGNVQTIEHLLYACVHIKPVWQKVSLLFHTNITFSMILGEDTRSPYNNVFSVVSFLIYKCWLLASLESKCRDVDSLLYNIKAELKARICIYQNCKNINGINLLMLENLLDSW
jgi:hypothetical protein